MTQPDPARRRQGAVRAAPPADQGRRSTRCSRAASSSSARTSARSRRRPRATSALRETIGVGNGTDAIVLVLNALEIGAGRRGHLPGVHVLRDRRGDRPRRRDAGLRGHRPADAQPRPGDVSPRRITPEHEGDHAGAPLRAARAARRARRARPAADRGRGAGLRLARDRRERASRRPSASTRRRTCSASGTAASSR